MPELIVKLEDRTLQTCRFDGELLRIGRSRENDIVLDNLSVSRLHAQIRFHDHRYTITDLNSANGVLLNGVRATKAEVVDADVITVGRYKLVFSCDSEEISVSAEPDAKRASASERPEAVLEVLSGRLKGREFKVVRFETTLGKAASNDIVITDDWLLAKQQAIILRKGNREFEIQDLGGLRRVKVNGVAIAEHSDLKHGDHVELGGTKLQFMVEQPKPRRAGVFMADQNTPIDHLLSIPNKSDPSTSEEPPASAACPKEDSLDLDGSFESMRLCVDKQLEQEQESERESGDEIPDESAASDKADQDSIGDTPEETDDAPDETESEPEEIPPADEKEVEIWESALENPSPAIRRQAARTLKKLTGRDYDV